MDNQEKLLQQKFIDLLRARRSGNLANALMELLPLEKEAIYRRLRGDVPFSFAEMATIATYFGISLDQIANIVSPFRSQGYKLHIRDYSGFKPIDLNMSHNYVASINLAADCPYSEYGIAGNMLPLHINLLHLPLYHLYLLKWLYLFDKGEKERLNYANICVPQEEEDVYAKFNEAVQRVKQTYFVWDRSLIQTIINDINYFYSIRLINPEDLQILKKELFSMLDTLERYADQEAYSETGNRIETYVSALNFEASYCYLSSEKVNISMSYAHTLNAFTSVEKEDCNYMKQWILGLKKSSTLISGVAQRDKVIFFDKQRETIDKQLIIR